MFPRFTFLEPRRTFPLKTMDATYATNLGKYDARGWIPVDIDEKPAEIIDKGGFQIPPESVKRIARRIGDSQCWTLPLNTAGVSISTTPDYVLELCEFAIRKKHRGINPSYYNIRSAIRDFSALKHTYIWHSHQGEEFWSGFVMHKIREVTVLEIEKMSEADRPAWFTEEVHSRLTNPDAQRSFEKPDTWTCYDDQLGGWYEEWKAIKSTRAEHSRS